MNVPIEIEVEINALDDGRFTAQVRVPVPVPGGVWTYTELVSAVLTFQQSR